MPPPDTTPKPIESGMENSSLMMGGPAQAFPEQDHDAHIATHVSLLNMSPVQMNAQIQGNIHSHIMQHLQLKADAIAQQQMPPEAMQQYQQMQQQAQQMPPQEAAPLMQQAQAMLAQFSSPIMSELMQQFAEQVSAPSQEDPLVTIRKQELALKGQELSQDQQQFESKEKLRMEEKLRQDKIDVERIQAQKDIAELKDDTTRDRMDQQKELKLIDIGLKQL